MSGTTADSIDVVMRAEIGQFETKMTAAASTTATTATAIEKNMDRAAKATERAAQKMSQSMTRSRQQMVTQAGYMAQDMASVFANQGLAGAMNAGANNMQMMFGGAGGAAALGIGAAVVVGTGINMAVNAYYDSVTAEHERMLTKAKGSMSKWTNAFARIDAAFEGARWGRIERPRMQREFARMSSEQLTDEVKTRRDKGQDLNFELEKERAKARAILRGYGLSNDAIATLGGGDNPMQALSHMMKNNPEIMKNQDSAIFEVLQKTHAEQDRIEKEIFRNDREIGDADSAWRAARQREGQADLKRREIDELKMDEKMDVESIGNLDQDQEKMAEIFEQRLAQAQVNLPQLTMKNEGAMSAAAEINAKARSEIKRDKILEEQKAYSKKMADDLSAIRERMEERREKMEELAAEL